MVLPVPRARVAKGAAATQQRLVDLAAGLSEDAVQAAIGRLSELARARGVAAGRIGTAAASETPIARLVALLTAFVPSALIRRAIAP